jgi:hypothetical protein
MSNISPSAITTDAEFEKQIAGADFEQIKILMAERAVQQGLVKKDIYDPSVLIPTEAATAPAPQKVGKIVVLNGIKHSLVAADQEDLLAQELALYRGATAQIIATETRTEQPRDERGQFVAAEDAATKTELERAFQRGEISASEYIERSGAVANYLEKQGVPLADLQEAVAEKQGARFENDWKTATDRYLASPAGRDWVGGEENMKLVGQIIQQEGWVDAEDKQAAIEAAVQHLRENDLLVENPEVTARQKISEARSVEEIREALGRSSSLFGR